MIHPHSSTTMTVSRKRPRIDPQQRSAHYQTPRASSSYDLTASISSFGAASPSPLVNTDYFLSGGLDTPGAWSEHKLEWAQEMDAEKDYRQSRFAQRSPNISFASPLEVSMSQSMQDASNRTALASSRPQWTVGRAAWALTGGLAGKIFNFCWNSTFRGFQAGGGQAYTDYAQVITSASPANNEVSQQRHRHKIPGSYPENRNSQDYQNTVASRPDSSSRPSLSYHRQISEDSVVKDNWVFLEHSHVTQDEHSPVRKRPRASVAGSGRQDMFQPVQPPRSTLTASFASPRSRTASTSSIHARPHSAGKRSRPSLASPSRRQSSLFGQQSPASPEIETYQRKKRREDKKQDESLRRLNAHLQDMIKEGQQALGSKIEIVDDDDVDEGYFDNDFH